MRILIIGKQHFAMDTSGQRGRELAYLMPEEVEWDQLAYGQGEGQVRALECKWGIYWEGPHRLSLEVEEGQVQAERAIVLANQIATKLFGPARFELILAS
jgi:hypothetical protein